MEKIVIHNVKPTIADKFNQQLKQINDYSTKKYTSADLITFLIARGLPLKKTEYDYLVEKENSYLAYINKLLDQTKKQLLNGNYSMANNLINALMEEGKNDESDN
ncbi:MULTISPECIES: hypothetical protein [Lactobacillus]|uniref:hypothetical protein n=1 Tax=Lactobacillus TaxID=1578 RepID=UPI0024936763|nr:MULTISPECIES: hypothetical protein [Lactobacillus]